MTYRDQVRAAVTKAMDAQKIDAWVYPTWSNPPRLIGDLNTPGGDNSQFFSPTTGFPAIQVPMGYTRGGRLPAGITFFGRAWSEPDADQIRVRLRTGDASSAAAGSDAAASLELQTSRPQDLKTSETSEEIEMAINGTHMLFYTSEAEKLRAMLRDVFGFKWVDAHGGWLIFRLPPAEVGVHPGRGTDVRLRCPSPDLVHVRRHPQDDRRAAGEGRRSRR